MARSRQRNGLGTNIRVNEQDIRGNRCLEPPFISKSPFKGKFFYSGRAADALLENQVSEITMLVEGQSLPMCPPFLFVGMGQYIVLDVITRPVGPVQNEQLL